MARRVPEGQTAFNFDDDPAVPAKPIPRVWKWNWWDPWPSGLTDVQCYARQIARDERALEEAESPEEAEFFRERAELFRQELKRLETKVDV